MRTDQYIGLNLRAAKWLEENCKKVTVTVTTTTTYEGKVVTEHTNTYNDLMSEPYDAILGAWTDNAGNLLYYSLKDGRQAREYVQATPWSSGPMYFVALKIDDEPIQETLWTDQEIENEGEQGDYVTTDEENFFEEIGEYQSISENP